MKVIERGGWMVKRLYLSSNFLNSRFLQRPKKVSRGNKFDHIYAQSKQNLFRQVRSGSIPGLVTRSFRSLWTMATSENTVLVFSGSLSKEQPFVLGTRADSFFACRSRAYSLLVSN